MRPRDDSAPRHRLPPRDRRRLRPQLDRRAPVASAVAVLALAAGATAGVVVASSSGPELASHRAEGEEKSAAGGDARPGTAGAIPVPADSGRQSLRRDETSRGEAGSPTASSGGDAPLGAAASTAATVLPARGPVVRAAAVLRAWDEQRARAWAEGDTDALRDLYVDGAGASDVRLLRRYAERGYRVEGMTTQLLAVDVLASTPVRWRLRVTDRLAGAVAVRGHERLRLPLDRADTHVITLVLGEDGRWRVAWARPV